MITLSEILRWFVYRTSSLYYRIVGKLLGRDRLLSGSERKFRALLEAAPAAMVIVNWHGHIALVNAQAERMFGYDRREIVGQSIGELLPERMRAVHRHHLKLYMRDPQTRPMGTDAELLGQRSDGTEFPVEISLSPLSTDEGLLVSAGIRDITERRRNEERLQYLADHDALTGLLNRRSFEERLDHAVAVADRYSQDGSMLMIDIDGLKDINDSVGHARGDELLKSIGGILAARLRSTDIIARVGGDEFGVLMPNTSIDDARLVADDLLETVRDHTVVIDGRRRQASISLGVANFGHGMAEAAEVMVAADIALYAAKDQGRDQVMVNPPQDSAASVVRKPWSQRIRRALDEHLFVPYRQPILSLESREIARFELLARLREEDGTVLAPASFLATAERSGMIDELDRRMAGWAIDLIAQAEAAGKPVGYEVNISARSVNDDGFPAMIAERIRTTGIDPALLIFEITETAAISNMELARAFAQTLRSFGCRFALDDFGTGFASFYYLKHLPLDALKIDGDFIRNLTTNSTDQLLVRHIAEIAQSLELITIAEYVTDSETLELLAELGVDLVQGFEIGEPEPISGFDTAPVRVAAERRVSRA